MAKSSRIARRARRSGEFELIRRFVSGWPLGEEVVIGAGDDASAVRWADDSGRLLLQTADLLVENVHFRKGWGSSYQLGWKSLAVNLSDIAAMGGRPLHAHLNLALPTTWSEAEIMQFRQGFFDLAEKYRVALLGGDLSASPGPLMISVMLTGAVAADRVLRRSGAHSGDVVWVSGSLGDAAAGLKLLKKGSAGRNTSGGEKELMMAFLQPNPEIELGLVCSESRAVSALIDLSDGLAGDLGHILEMSGVGAVLDEERLPMSRALLGEARRRDWDHLEMAWRGGEDYRLLGCSPPDKFSEFASSVAERLERPLIAIGEISEGAGLRLRCRDGKIKAIAPRAFDHFA